MTPRILNQLVTVTSVRFTDSFDIVPRRIELDGISYDITNYERDNEQDELRVSDGTHRFRLRPGANANEWRLLGISL